MTNSFRTIALAAVLVSGAVSAFASHTVDYDHSVDFRSYKTFSFMKVQSDDPFVNERLRAEMTRDLTKAGWEMVATGGDVQIAAVEAEHDVKQYNTFYEGLGGGGWGWGGGGWYGGGWGGGWGGGPYGGERSTTVREIPVGTLVVDMYDARTHQIIWRGKASSELSDKADKNIKKFNKDIDQLLNGFPPPSKG